MWRRQWGGALLFDPGTGKTKTALDFAGALYLYKGVKRVLVVSSVRAFGTWKSEAKKHLPPEVPYVVIRVNKSKNVQKIWDPYHPSRLRIVVVNYETAWRIVRPLRSWKPELVVLDDSHKIRRRTTRKTRGCYQLSRATPRRIIMTGTAVTEAPEDLFSQWKFLKPDRFGTRYRDFEEKYMRISGPWKQVVVYQNLGDLQALAAQDANVAKKDECLDLPPKVFQDKFVELDPKTRRLYDKMEADMVVELESGLRVTAEIVLTKSLRLAQLASGIASQKNEQGERQIELVGSEKLEALRDILEDYCTISREKVVIFCRFRPSLDRVGELLDKIEIPYRYIRGKMSYKATDESEKWLWEGKGPKVIVAQIQAGGQAVNLQCSSTAIYYEMDYSAENYLQSQDRIHRVGQDRDKVIYIHIMAEDSLEPGILQALRDKESVADALIRGIKERAGAKAA